MTQAEAIEHLVLLRRNLQVAVGNETWNSVKASAITLLLSEKEKDAIARREMQSDIQAATRRIVRAILMIRGTSTVSNAIFRLEEVVGILTEAVNKK